MKKMLTRRRVALTIVIGFVLPSSNSRAIRGTVADVSDAVPICGLPAGVISHGKESEMPAVLREVIRHKLGHLVPPRGPFDATDVVRTGQNRRLIFIWVRGSTWVLATEHGGRGYNDPIFAYEVDSSGEQVKLVAERIAFPLTVCSVAGELINQAYNSTQVR